MFLGRREAKHVYSLGWLAAIGIGHLTDDYADLTASKEGIWRVEDGMEGKVESEFRGLPAIVLCIVGVLMQAAKGIGFKVLDKLPVGGNVKFEDVWDRIDGIKYC